MKQWKPGLLIDGVPLIVRSLMPALETCSEIVVVGGYLYQDLKRTVFGSDALKEKDKAKIVFAENINFSTGMFSSVQTGAREIQSDTGGIYVVPGDMPFVKAETYSVLARRAEERPGSQVFVPAFHVKGGESGEPERTKKGHPILLRGDTLPAILNETPNAILRDVLRNIPQELCIVADEGICIDIDEEADLSKPSSSSHEKRQ